MVRASGQDRYAEIAFIDDDDTLAAGSTIHGAPFKGNSAILADLDRADFEICIAVGKPAVRRRMALIAEQSGCALATIIDPTATVRSSAVIEDGVVVAARAFVSCDVRLASHSMVNVGCTIGHDVTIGAYCVVSPGALILGGVTLGEGVEVGSGASVFPGTSVGAWSKIAMGSAVYKQVDENMIVSGNPARPISKNEPRWYAEDGSQK